ncbi:MAG: putative ferredoxin [Pedosphaera sp.]|nr:putative ferredoxin [Pedosphaera sp.]
MANPNDKHPENVPGRWYVDTACIGCGMCEEYAEFSFRPASDGSQHIVYRQPVTDAELAAANESKESCPVDAIGNDG